MIAKTYDAIFVLGGGLRKEGEEYYPARYEDSDDFGMLGGHMRLRAAVDLYKAGISNAFVFTSGVYEKNKAKFGADVPPEADVYAKRFSEMVEDSGARPIVILENESVSTLTNMKQALAIIVTNHWKNVAILSNEYHIPRVRALYQKVLEQHPELQVQIDFISAEDVVHDASSGVFDDEVKAAYASAEGLRRLENEAQGLRDIQNGTYAIIEFQIAQKTEKGNSSR